MKTNTFLIISGFLIFLSNNASGEEICPYLGEAGNLFNLYAALESVPVEDGKKELEASKTNPNARISFLLFHQK